MIYNSKFGGYTCQKPVFMSSLFISLYQISYFLVIFVLKFSPLIYAVLENFMPPGHALRTTWHVHMPSFRQFILSLLGTQKHVPYSFQ